MTGVESRETLIDAGTAAWDVRAMLILAEFACDKFEYVPEREREAVIDSLGRIIKLLIPRHDLVIDALDGVAAPMSHPKEGES